MFRSVTKVTAEEMTESSRAEEDCKQEEPELQTTESKEEHLRPRRVGNVPRATDTEARRAETSVAQGGVCVRASMTSRTRFMLLNRARPSESCGLKPLFSVRL